ncbi:MAG: hypothetical protein H7X80_03310 [bacterium]|nr:hypothetical protein [Candidatus Kapabacteria bacterium]
MLRIILRSLLLCLALLFTISHSSAADADVDQLARWIEGTYTNIEQSTASTEFEHLRMHIRRVWHTEPAGYWFYVEMRYALAQHVAGRQAFLYVHRRSDRKIVAEVFNIQAPLNYVGAWYDTTLIADLQSDALMRDRGCDFILTRKGKSFSGATTGKECLGELAEFGYEKREMNVSESELRVWDRGFSSDGKQIGGPVKVGYVFKKLDASDPGSYARTMERALDHFRGMQTDEAIEALDSIEAIDSYNADAYAIRASARSYQGETNAAVEAARKAVSISPCHGFGQYMLGDLYDPSYSQYAGADADSMLFHLLKSVECDPTRGNAWMGIWIESLRRVDNEMRMSALTGMRESGLITPAALAVARWYLRDVPRNAVMITAGEFDTYPFIVVQETEGYRRDVAVVSSPLMRNAWYLRYMRDFMDVDIPFTDAEIDELQTHLDDQNRAVYVDRQVIAAWTDQIRQRAVRRPIIFSTSWQLDEDAPPLEGWGRDAGTHALPSGRNFVDTAALRRRLMDVDGVRFRGPFISERDYSPLRRMAVHGANAIPRVAMLLRNEQLSAGDVDAARNTARWLRTFVQSARLDGWDQALDEIEMEIGN